MATLRLSAYSKEYPFITNRIRASIYKQTSPNAFIASIIDDTPGHPERVYDFLGLPRQNYGFRLDEIDSDNFVVANLAKFAVVPSERDGSLCRGDEQYQADITPGFVSGINTFTFDGREISPGINAPDLVGWDIVPSELTGRGILIKDVDYSWDKEFGTFTLLADGDIFPPLQYMNFKFDCQDDTLGNSYPTLRDFEILLITASTTIDESYFGKKVICEPEGVYMMVTLPEIDTVVEGREMMVEIGGTGILTVEFKPKPGQAINYLRGTLYAMAGESFSIYKYARASGVHEWRVAAADGNFRSCGQSVGDDMLQVDCFNKQLLDGSSVSNLQYARIYNEVVLNLPLTQVVAYDSWSTGNNKYLFSLANSADVGNAGKFRFPDRRGLFERNNATGKSGDYFNQSMEEHIHEMGVIDGIHNGVAGWGRSTGRPPISWGLINAGGSTGRAITDKPARKIDQSTISILRADGTPISTTETRPVNHLINRYILL